MKNRKSENNCRSGMNLPILLGLLLCAAALVLAGYNIWDDYQAGKNADQALEVVANAIEANTNANEDSVLEKDMVPKFISEPEIEMTVEMINGQEYIGIVEIPELELKLPVISKLSDARLKLAPCRYVGTAYGRDMIISGHSYKNHFRYIRKLEPGDKVIFTDMIGNRFVYNITDTEVIAETNVDQMMAGEWDLTLFTCTPNGSSRHTVRCTLAEDENPWMKYLGE